MMRIVKNLQRIARLVEIATLNFCVLLAVIMCTTLLAELIARSFLGTTLIWSAELATMCFVWIAFMGSTAAARRREHFSVDLIERWAPAGSRLDFWLKVLTAIVFSGYGAVLLINGISFVESGMQRFSFSLGIPKGYTMLIMPASGALFLFYGLLDLMELFVDKKNINMNKENINAERA